jgi:hypothetical protein
VLLVGSAALLGRLQFDMGGGYAVPTQVVFVPMLFVLPPAIVPVAIASASLLDRVPDRFTRRWHPHRLITAIGDGWYSIGPAIVFGRRSGYLPLLRPSTTLRAISWRCHLEVVP